MRRVWRDENGERHWVRGDSEQEIADKIAEQKFKIKMGQDKIDGKMTVKAWAKNWLHEYIDPRAREPGEPKKRGTMTQKSCDMYHQKTDGYIIPALGHYRLCDVRDIHLQKLLNTQKGLSDSHVKKLRIVMEAMFTQAFNSRLIHFNPAADLELPAAESGKRRSLTDYERQVILEVAKTHPHGLWVRFLLATGIRPGESAPLQVYDLIFDDPQPRVKIYKDIESGTEDRVSAPKTEAGNREIPLPQYIIPDLKKAVAGKPKDAWVFPFKDGTMLTETRLSNNWQSFLRQVDLAMGAETTPNGHIYDPKDRLSNGKPKYPDPHDPKKPRNGHKVAPDLTPYCLRHTYCTDLQRKGVPLNVARYLMGHTNIAVTANIYTHNGEEEVVMAGALIDGLAFENTAKKGKAADA
ncbi:MAG TPA: hypothetical protein DCR31_06255 [Ruminococcaceae bacterium]|nr:hypothetical protein [Oscillospiraceae bacterium]